MTQTLSIQKHIPEIKKALETHRCAVIQAQPGAGKTTRVPLALLDEPWLKDKKIIMLEPRRLAAKSCAAHMAGLLKEKPGQTIGYQIRLDRKIGPKTRIEVITEGIFTRMIQQDPSLEDVGLVVFDEFHERNIHSDLGLALCLETFEVLRDDLHILVMSATMDVNAVSQLFGRAPVIVSKGKSFRVKTFFMPALDRQKRRVPIETGCALVVKQALSETNGDILVFLPGVKEIKTLYSILKETQDLKINILPLYANLSQKDQARAFFPSNHDERKIVLATSIAETSITIEGITVVIDSGLMRVPRYSSQTGMSRLETLTVSKATADQRRGRAGRTAPGVCYRLWSEHDHRTLKPFTRPEILSADLTGVALELAAWGVKDPGDLKWLDLPEEKAFTRAKNILKTLGVLDTQGRITSHGSKMALTGLHPRLAHMVIKGEEKGLGIPACRIAAFLNERDFIRFDEKEFDPDIQLRLDLIEQVVKKQKIHPKGFKINYKTIHRIIESANKFIKNFNIKSKTVDMFNAGTLLAHAYPDRIAKKRSNKDNTFLMASGKGAFFTGINTVSMSEYIVAVHVDGSTLNAKIFLAAPYLYQDLKKDFGDGFKMVNTLFWDKKEGAVKAKEEITFGKLVVQQCALFDFDMDMASDILIEEIKKKGLGVLPWTKKLLGLKDRIIFLKNTGLFKDLPDFSDKTLENDIAVWLKPFLTGIYSLKQLAKIDFESIVLSMLTFEQQQVVDQMAPTHIRVPSGSRIPLKYTGQNSLLDAPILQVRLQEMFGLTSTPKIAGNRICITIHLLSPAGRPVQITKDLASFWKNTYKGVKKDLSGRYPKHFWPDDPVNAKPTNRAKKRAKTKPHKK